MAKLSAGILLYRHLRDGLEVFLVHPGGPYWATKDVGAWSVPKGEYCEGDDPLSAARREFEEETGMIAPDGDLMSLRDLKQASGKIVKVWALHGDCDAAGVRSNKFSVEWPPRSGVIQQFPEIDRAEWFPIEVARTKILKGQVGFLEELARRLGYRFKLRTG